MNKLINSLFIALGVLLLAGCAHQQSSQPSDVSIIQSPNDPRSYEYLVLPNEL